MTAAAGATFPPFESVQSSSHSAHAMMSSAAAGYGGFQHFSQVPMPLMDPTMAQAIQQAAAAYLPFSGHSLPPVPPMPTCSYSPQHISQQTQREHVAGQIKTEGMAEMQHNCQTAATAPQLANIWWEQSAIWPPQNYWPVASCQWNARIGQSDPMPVPPPRSPSPLLPTPCTSTPLYGGHQSGTTIANISVQNNKIAAIPAHLRSQQPPSARHHFGPGTNMRTKDQYRRVYNDSQRMQLEQEFAVRQFINSERKTALSNQLKLTERQIKIWFQNRRAKERKQKKQEKQQNALRQQLVPNFGFQNPMAPSVARFPPFPAHHHQNATAQLL